MTNAKYIQARNALIPKAEAEASRKVSPERSIIRVGNHGRYKHYPWNHFFHAAMNRLAFEAGLTTTKL